MDTLADLARALLAVTFTVAAVAKLLDLTSARRTMAAFGLPPGAARRAGTALPFAELATAIALVIAAASFWGGVAALGLLVLFIGGISFALSQGRKPPCNCFGQIAAEPIGWRTLVRNAILAVAAALVVAQDTGASLFAWADKSTVGTIAALLALALVAAVMAGLKYRQQVHDVNEAYDRLNRRSGAIPAGVPVGLRAPEFALASTRGETVTLASLCARGRPVFLTFVSPDCGPCIRLLPEIARWHEVMGDDITFAVVSNGGGSDQAAIVEQLRAAGDATAVVQDTQEVADQYRVLATPTALVVDPDGKVASGSAAGPIEIEALVRIALERASNTDNEPPRAVVQSAA